MNEIVGNVFSGVIAAVISAIIAYSTLKKQSNLQYITSERQKWRETITEIAEKLNGANYNKTKELLVQLKVRINPYGKDLKKGALDYYYKDGHIWELIQKIEEKPLDRKDLQNRQNRMIEYLSLLLKSDWERSKQEVHGNMYKGLYLTCFATTGVLSGIFLFVGSCPADFLSKLAGYVLIVFLVVVLSCILLDENTNVIYSVFKNSNSGPIKAFAQYCAIYSIIIIVLNIIFGILISTLTKDFNFNNLQKGSLMFIFMFGTISLYFSKTTIVENNLNYVRTVKNLQE